MTLLDDVRAERFGAATGQSEQLTLTVICKTCGRDLVEVVPGMYKHDAPTLCVQMVVHRAESLPES